MGMNGFVKSNRPAGVYCMKRHIRPGQKVALDELYEQYGVRHNISAGPEFVKWLRTVKLRRRDIWEIMFDGVPIVSGDEPFEALKVEEAVEVAEKKPAGKVSLEGDIKVEDSGESDFSFPAEKKESVNDKSKFTKRIKGSNMKAVKARDDGRDKPAITPRDILGLKVDKLDEVDKVEDIRVLKIALRSAEDMRNKATLCKRLKIRINKLKPRSRFSSV